MEADLLDFPELQDAQSLKKRSAESYTCSMRRASTPFQAGFQPRRNPCGSLLSSRGPRCAHAARFAVVVAAAFLRGLLGI